MILVILITILVYLAFIQFLYFALIDGFIQEAGDSGLSKIGLYLILLFGSPAVVVLLVAPWIWIPVTQWTSSVWQKLKKQNPH